MNLSVTSLLNDLELICLVLLLFNGISTFQDYLMPNPSFEKDSSKLICLHTSTAIVSTQLDGFNYSYLCNIKHLFAHSEVVTSIAIKY